MKLTFLIYGWYLLIFLYSLCINWNRKVGTKMSSKQRFHAQLLLNVNNGHGTSDLMGVTAEKSFPDPKLTHPGSSTSGLELVFARKSRANSAIVWASAQKEENSGKYAKNPRKKKKLAKITPKRKWKAELVVNCNYTTPKSFFMALPPRNATVMITCHTFLPRFSLFGMHARASHYLSLNREKEEVLQQRKW